MVMIIAVMLGSVYREKQLLNVFSLTAVKTNDSIFNRKQAAVDSHIFNKDYTIKPLLNQQFCLK